MNPEIVVGSMVGEGAPVQTQMLLKLTPIHF